MEKHTRKRRWKWCLLLLVMLFSNVQTIQGAFLLELAPVQENGKIEMDSTATKEELSEPAPVQENEKIEMDSSTTKEDLLDYVSVQENEKIELDSTSIKAEISKPISVQENEKIELDSTVLEELDFSNLDEILKEQEFLEEIDFKDLVEKLINGEEIDKKWLLEKGINILCKEIHISKEYMIQIILLLAAFALLYNFANVFENTAVTDVSFYIVYMILLSLLMNSFMVMSGILEKGLHTILDFMQALMPAFCLTIVVSTGTVSAMGFYQLTIFLIYLIESILFYVILPVIHIYIILEMLNHITKEEVISKMTELIKIAVEWVLKCLLALVIGMNIVQGMLAPVMDNLKSNAIVKTAGAIPGIGGSIQAVTEIMMSSGIIIKNGVGIAGIFILVFLCAGPLLKVGIMTLLYKISAAVIQPIADKRLVGCVSGVGEGARLLGKTLLVANIMLVVTLALVTVATTWNR